MYPAATNADEEAGMGAQEPLTGVGATALGVARVRARESGRPDRLFHDPYAAAFLDGPDAARPGSGRPGPAPTDPDTSGPAPTDSRTPGPGTGSRTPSPAPTDSRTPGSAPTDSRTPGPGTGSRTPGPAPTDSRTPGSVPTGSGTPGRARSALAFHAVIRTRFYDDYLLAACDTGCRQVVLLAAGLDTRAYRLTWPDGVRLFELDLPEVLSFKDTVLTGRGAAPRCERVALPADLRTDWAGRLTGTAFDPAVPTAWLAEGLLVYLTAEETAGLLTSVGELSAPGSRLSFERGDAARHATGTRAPDAARYTSLWKGGLGEDAAGWLTRHGWRPGAHELADLAVSYGRPAPAGSRSGFVTATYGG
jgi:methyltransferase (TIGR00027 family)